MKYLTETEVKLYITSDSTLVYRVEWGDVVVITLKQQLEPRHQTWGWEIRLQHMHSGLHLTVYHEQQPDLLDGLKRADAEIDTLMDHVKKHADHKVSYQ